MLATPPGWSVIDPPGTITPYSLCSIGGAMGSLGGSTSATYPAASRAIYIPFRLASPVTVTNLWSVNGATASGNIDLAVYSGAGRRLVSAGSTAQAGTNVKQTFDVTDTVIGPGLFYLAVAMDNTTGTLFRCLGGSSAARLKLLGMAQEAAAFPLPATATFATLATANIPCIGATVTAAEGAHLLAAPPCVTISPWSLESLGSSLVASGGTEFDAAAAAVWPTQNMAIYVPFRLAAPITVTQIMVFNGATVNGNVDVGIYSRAGRRLVSAGSTAMSGGSATQAFNITDTVIGPGLFYLAMASDSATATFSRGQFDSAEQVDTLGCYQQAAAFALPATATFATMAQNYIPQFALTTRSVV